MNPTFELYKANVLMLAQHEKDLSTYKRVKDEVKATATQGKIRSLTKVVDDYEKKFRFRKYMVYGVK